jgi:hypothetical protein
MSKVLIGDGSPLKMAGSVTQLRQAISLARRMSAKQTMASRARYVDL